MKMCVTYLHTLLCTQFISSNNNNRKISIDVIFFVYSNLFIFYINQFFINPY